MMYWHGGGGWILMVFNTLIFAALLVTVGVLVYRMTRDQPRTTESSAVRILSDRYARGDIDEEEYNRRLEVLHRQGTGRRR